MDLSQVLDIAGRSDAGRVRSHNEDSIAMRPESGLFVLADGMGGYNAGEVASGIATAVIGEGLHRAWTEAMSRSAAGDTRALARRLLVEQVNRANASIYARAQSEPQCAGMGTTLVVALFHDNALTVGHIGDSRLYRLRGEELRILTRDHSLLQEQLDNGIITRAQARQSHNRNLVTRALGIDVGVETEVHDYEVAPDDVYLLCSDGLNDMLDDETIHETLRAGGEDLEAIAGELIRRANDNGGRDNISVILVRVASLFSARLGWLDRMRSWFR